MNYFVFNAPMEEDPLQKFFDAEKNFNKEEELTIYLNSDGGSCSVMYTLMHYIDNYPKDVTIVSVGMVCSCAWSLFMFSNSKKVVMPMTEGVIHLYSIDISVREMKDKKCTTYSEMKDLDKDNTKFLEDISLLGIKSKIVKDVSNGKDVTVFNAELRRQARMAQKLFYKPKKGAK